MAAPRIFLSSTYYDLKQVRSDIGKFIQDLGYVPVMNENADIPYTQQQALEYDCYGEILSCDVLVCMIGNSFGSQSTFNELSITMNELEQAIKNRKLIYVFIEKSVFYENKTYRKNATLQGFTPAAVNDIKVHQFIKALIDKVGREKYIQPFDTAQDIIDKLRTQFAGLFQSLLTAKQVDAESLRAYELHNEVVNLKQLVEDIRETKAQLEYGLGSTVLVNNPLITYIEKLVGVKRFHFSIKDIWALDEALGTMGYGYPIEWDSQVSDVGLTVGDRHYEKKIEGKTIHLQVKKEAFLENGMLKVIVDRKVREGMVKYWEDDDESTQDLPF